MFDIDDRMLGNLHKRARSRGGRHFLGLSHGAISIFRKECNAERLVKCLTAKVNFLLVRWMVLFKIQISNKFSAYTNTYLYNIPPTCRFVGASICLVSMFQTNKMECSILFHWSKGAYNY